MKLKPGLGAFYTIRLGNCVGLCYNPHGTFLTLFNTHEYLLLNIMAYLNREPYYYR